MTGFSLPVWHDVLIMSVRLLASQASNMDLHDACENGNKYLIKKNLEDGDGRSQTGTRLAELGCTQHALVLNLTLSSCCLGIK